MPTIKPLTLMATTPMGIESIATKELHALGYEDLQVENGKITFQGDWWDVCRVNLWIRTVDRIKIIMGEFTATSFEELFEQTKALPWADLLPENAQFPVTGKSIKSQLYSVPDCQAITKKAIVESLKQVYHNVWFPEDGPLYKIDVSILKDKVTLSLDTSGEGLHKRGYRYLHGEAPIKETLAAALIYLTHWTPDRPFVDPFCGSGTIPIEAAMIGQNIAPGFNRSFLAETWSHFDPKLWEQARIEVEDLAKYDQPLDISGSDIDHRMVELSQNNAIEAGFGDLISFKQMQATDFTTKKQYGTLVTNPPYGERIGEAKQIEKLYREMGKVFQKYDTWSFYYISSHPDFEKLYGKSATKKRKLYNGRIRTDYYQYWGPRPPKNES